MKELLFLGDSITDCGHSFDRDNLGDGYVRMIASEFQKHSSNYRMRNMGVDGFTISALHRLWNMSCTELRPDFITILIGINDLAMIKNTGLDFTLALQEFEQKYDLLLQEILASTDCPVLLMEPFIFPKPAVFATWEPALRKMNQVIQQLAKFYDLDYLPLWEDLSKEALELGYDQITVDGVHLTFRGHRILCEHWIDYYKKRVEKSNVQKIRNL